MTVIGVVDLAGVLVVHVVQKALRPLFAGCGQAGVVKGRVAGWVP